MKSQKIRLKELLHDMGVHFQEKFHTQGSDIAIQANDCDKGKQDGYWGFVCTFIFDKVGRHVKTVIVE